MVKSEWSRSAKQDIWHDDGGSVDANVESHVRVASKAITSKNNSIEMRAQHYNQGHAIETWIHKSFSSFRADLYDVSYAIGRFSDTITTFGGNILQTCSNVYCVDARNTQLYNVIIRNLISRVYEFMFDSSITIESRHEKLMLQAENT
jgi:hypothetical protein